MDIVVDGIVYQRQASGGISRIFDEILPRMCDIDVSLNVEILTSGQLKRRLPVHSNIHCHSIFPIDQFLRPSWFWRSLAPAVRAFIHQKAVGNSRRRIWHSTYYTSLKDWQGPSVVTVVDMIHELFPNLFGGPLNDQFRAQKQRAILDADAIICISETTQKDVQEAYGIDPAKVQVIPLAHSEVFRCLDPPSHVSDRSASRPFLLYVGARFHYKNFAALLDAYSIWPNRDEVNLIVVGEKWTEEEIRQLDRLRIGEHVHLLEQIDDQHLCDLYNQAVALVYPSLYEGFGIPLLEAMACGCPVVASHIPSTVEVAGKCPIYFEPMEQESWHAAFDVALSEGRNSDRVEEGLKQVRQYSWEEVARQTLMVYRTVEGV